MYLWQPRLRYSACGPFTKKQKKNSKIQRNRDSTYIYQNELEKAWFQHDMAHGDFIELSRKTSSDKALRDEAFNIAKNPKYDG